jgi:uncharacterized membrane protein HdeD (DUF308 family)
VSRADRKEADLAWKGGLCSAIGLAVLLAPQFMAPSGMRDTIAQSAIVGWFALVLGLAFIGHYLWRRRSGPR